MPKVKQPPREGSLEWLAQEIYDLEWKGREDDPQKKYFKPRKMVEKRATHVENKIQFYFKKLVPGGYVAIVDVNGREIKAKKEKGSFYGIPVDIETQKGKYGETNATLGFSDTVCMYRGFTIYPEVKWNTDTQSEDQKAFQENVERAGCIYLIVKNFEDFYNQWKPIRTAIDTICDMMEESGIPTLQQILKMK